MISRDLTRGTRYSLPPEGAEDKGRSTISSGRFMYEAVYDVGPQPFQDVRDRTRRTSTTSNRQYDLWEAYVDLSRGPLFFRIGRQNLAWGETDVFRLLDGINPLDNTFGGALRGSGRSAHPVVDAAGELQFRPGGSCFGPDGGRLLGARQLGRAGCSRVAGRDRPIRPLNRRRRYRRSCLPRAR